MRAYRPIASGAPAENSFQFVDQLTHIRGKHSIKGGFEYRPQQYDSPFPAQFGSYNFTAFASKFTMIWQTRSPSATPLLAAERGRDLALRTHGVDAAVAVNVEAVRVPAAVARAAGPTAVSGVPREKKYPQIYEASFWVTLVFRCISA
jgi:hypothetical protein